MGQVSPIVFPSHQLPSATSSQSSGVLNMRDKCDAAYSRDFGNVNT